MDDTTAGEGSSFEATETIGNLALDDKKPEKPKKKETPATSNPKKKKKEKKDVDISNIRYENVWKNVSEEVKKGVFELWDEQTGGAMTDEMKQERIKTVSVVAIDGEKVVAISTLSIQKQQSLWCTIGYFRCIVDADYRRKGVASQLAIRCKKVLAEYSEEHPKQQIKAMGIQMPIKFLGDRGKRPFWPELGMSLVGFGQGQMQLRIAWLDHVKLDL